MLTHNITLDDRFTVAGSCLLEVQSLTQVAKCLYRSDLKLYSEAIFNSQGVEVKAGTPIHLGITHWL